jgi:sRNA-binding regulator protein Hfq
LPNRPRPTTKIDRSTLEQDKFLDICQRQGTKLELYLEGNVMLQGWVHRHDRKVIEFGSKNPSNPPRLVSKSAVAFLKVHQNNR